MSVKVANISGIQPSKLSTETEIISRVPENIEADSAAIVVHETRKEENVNMIPAVQESIIDTEDSSSHRNGKILPTYLSDHEDGVPLRRKRSRVQHQQEDDPSSSPTTCNHMDGSPMEKERHDQLTTENEKKDVPPKSRVRKKKKRCVYSTPRQRNGNGKQRRQVTLPTSSEEMVNQETGIEDTNESIETSNDTTTTTETITWQWESCEMYFDPLTQQQMNQLEIIRKDCANFVASNASMAKRLEHGEDAVMYVLLKDATDTKTQRVCRTRRGRAYRERWEEEDFLRREVRLRTQGRAKKRPFVGCELMVNARELIHGYDDELFTDYLQRLEDKRDQNVSGMMQNHHVIPAHEINTLPAIPVNEVHPASCGMWILKELELNACITSNTVHPAAISRRNQPRRWIEELALESKCKQAIDKDSTDTASESIGSEQSSRHDSTETENDVMDNEAGSINTNEDSDKISESEESKEEEIVEDITLPNFGNVMEEDEISREIDSTLLQLISLSALNWRQTETLYERASCYIACTPLLEAENAAQDRLEGLYRVLYPASSTDNESDDETTIHRTIQLASRPRDIVAYSTRLSSGPTESEAVGVSTEYALRLEKGDEVDVLDRNGCWNDGVVVDVFVEGGQVVKFVLISCSHWGHDAVEWIAVTEGRVLPRGVADGRIRLSLPPSRVRKRRLEMNQALADVLELTYPTRRTVISAPTTSDVSTKTARIGSNNKKPRKNPPKDISNAAIVLN